MSQNPPVAALAPSPIFIGGMFKSGTTLLRAMLAQHHNIASGLETQWFNLPWGAGVDAPLLERLGRLAAFYDLPEAQVVDLAARAPSATHFVDRLMAVVAQRAGKPRWAEKTPGNVAHLDEIWGTWPDAQVVHIVRDPKDSFASLRLAGKAPSGLAYAQNWCSIVGENAHQKERLRPSTDRYLEIRYERLIFEPESVMRSVLVFLREPWDDACGRFDGKQDEFDRVLAVTGHASTTLDRLREPLTRSRIGIWPGVVSEDDLAEFRAEVDRLGHGEILRHLEDETATLLRERS